MKKESFEIFTREAADRPEPVPGYAERPVPQLSPRSETVDGMQILHDVKVPMRDGLHIYADVYLPEKSAENLGVIIYWGAFGKHATTNILPPDTDVTPDMVSKYTGWESPDPLYWTQHGYAVIYADPRGAWNSPGTYYMFGDEEMNDTYDLTEWAGVQSWSNGKVGFMGVSYPGVICWMIASRRPPHLAAIVPWEAWSDIYREFAYHGGMRETGHTRLVSRIMGWPGKSSEDLDKNYNHHPLYDGYWEYKNPDLEAIEVPVFACGSWSDQGLHTRGTILGWLRAGSKNKWLKVHGRKKWSEFYNPENVERQRAFFDEFLLGKQGRFDDQPKIEIEVRERAMQGVVRTENEWPIARTQLTPLYLEAGDGSLSREAIISAGQVSYDPTSNIGVTFDIRFDEDTELTGTMKLKLWVEAKDADDMDLFVALDKMDEDGESVGFPFFATHLDGPVALGWLRVSHRELDPERSTPQAPVLLHQREQLLSPGEIVPVEIEIWPSSTLFRKGESLRLNVQGTDINLYDDKAQNRHEDTRNKGAHIIHCGGTYDSHLLAPVIPAKG
ncbi:CocE/NonD family hydrolase [Agrobacterium vitis]|uniref:CocE/NonD family hydrolase n=1 Tax=Agrobacterium vitis TaxID=373 RepID=A0A6L6VJZ3_AGRVI|nr:CocE/NonD family hydrolase [Agrobacterium vitis]MUZ76014.1 CocE/NonD family hydrolase [Agrobacterium vitis]